MIRTDCNLTEFSSKQIRTVAREASDLINARPVVFTHVVHTVVNVDVTLVPFVAMVTVTVKRVQSIRAGAVEAGITGAIVEIFKTYQHEALCSD